MFIEWRHMAGLRLTPVTSARPKAADKYRFF